MRPPSEIFINNFDKKLLIGLLDLIRLILILENLLKGYWNADWLLLLLLTPTSVKIKTFRALIF